jgi:hypothetical protein
MFAAQSTAVDDLTESLIGSERMWRVNVPLQKLIALDDVTAACKTLPPLAEGVAQSQYQRVGNLLEINLETPNDVGHNQTVVFGPPIVHNQSASINWDYFQNLENAAKQDGRRILYNSAKREIGFDFHGKPGQFWHRVDDKNVPISREGLGTLTIENGNVLNVCRENNEGRYEVFLTRYEFDDAVRKYVPKNELMTGDRHLLVTLEAKVTGRAHTLRFVLTNEDTKRILISKDVRVKDHVWTQFVVPLPVTPAFDCFLRIDDQDVVESPSSVQIRNLVLMEIPS